MIRVCKPGGIVGAVEAAFDSVVWYVPSDDRFTELLKKRVTAENGGYRRVHGSDRGIAYKLPSIFKEEGLSRVRLDAYAHVWLEGDDRVPTDFKMESYKEELRTFTRPDDYEHILREGGMRSKEFKEFGRRNQMFQKRFIDDPKLLDTDTTTNGRIFFITTGMKGSN
jgi:hypothetical protein